MPYARLFDNLEEGIRGADVVMALADSPASVITEQVANGVAVRMAVLERVCHTMGQF